MSIYGIRGTTPGIPGGHGLPSARPRGDGGITTARDAKSATFPPPLPAEPKVAPGASPMPVQPPPGTDPLLWNVLSADERAYFAKLGAMGPLTYGRVLGGQMAPPAPATRGGRLDLKV